jgi:hypothetical protein
MIMTRTLRSCVFGAVCALITGRSLAAQQSDSASVVEASATLLRAISTKDTALARTVLLPGVQFASIGTPAAANTRARWQADSTFVRSLAARPDALLERMWSPAVTLYGSVATVAAPYDFYINGTFSHCGTDVFVLVKHENVWRISALQYTVQRQNCAPSPLGPPA